ncbi:MULTISPECIES: nitrogenase iron-molybdenum cofactor biosynthesis protein NifN [Paenibacillus]|uniref:Nitrogenase iron-molybdenum cofactor biosynthesis protein NifN n=1 Tax=Paenibacillus borealis TaxID=160799 RepID=A0ABX3H1J9_PAEBO|nr:nitrogenase iron-molybdenum cofactor biosynthesis protein NifN [Paenibacillus borealis]OMD43787.1 nitrogenase iron-molybdenum cofactor biosynthesis protein NifN [Paenibacillus borealis]
MDKADRAVSKPLSVNPFQTSQSVGGVLALQGIYRAVPVLHGAQGCAESVKTVLSRHFREPISLQNIAIHEQNLIFGGGDGIREMIRLVMERHHPDVVALIGTSLTEVVGEDLLGTAETYYRQHKEMFKDKLMCGLYLPDYEGSLESGYAKTVYSVIQKVIRSRGRLSRKKKRGRINLLPGSHLTPGDVMELKEMIASFDIEVIVLPDLSSSLTGHLMTGHTALSRGGIPLDYLREMLTSTYTVAIGSSMEPCARLLQEELQIPYQMFHGVTGLRESDEFFLFLRQFSQSEGQNKYRWQRQFLLDCLLDTRSVFRGKRILAALEPDHLVALYQCLSELGIKSFGSVISAASPAVAVIPEAVQVGDLEDLERMAAGGADLWLSNSYGEQTALKNGIPYFPLGFPVFNRFGSPANVSVGYRGTADLLNQIANIMNSKERIS